MAELVPCLVMLRSDFNRAFPGRDKESDGWIGDVAHQAEVSDHNPDSRGLVHAIDVDRDLRDPNVKMQDVVDHLVGDRRLKYVIFNKRIWLASHGWEPRAYTGKNPHDKHAHFSAVSTPSLERNTEPWLEDLMGATPEEVREIVREELATFKKIDPLATLLARSGEQQKRMAGALELLATLAGKAPADVDEAALGKAIAGAIPSNLAAGVADEIRRRLES